MTQISRPWNGITTGDAGPYSDSQWRQSWAALFHAWAAGTGYGNRGPIIDSGNAPNVGLQVQATSPASTSIEVLAGAAVVEGGLYLSDATETLSIAANTSGNPRIDTIVLRKDDIAQTIRLAVKQGTPAVTPAPPAMTQTAGTMWEIPLADIDVANGFASISNDEITSRAEWANAADGVYLKDVLNNSGVTLEDGTPVIWDSTADRAVTRTTTANNFRAAGVWQGRTQNGDYGRILIKGIGHVNVDGTITQRLRGLVFSSTAGLAKVADGNTKGQIGWTLGTRTGAGRVLAYIDTQAGGDHASYRNTSAAYNTQTNSTSFVDADAANLNLTITTHGHPVEIILNGVLREAAGGATDFAALTITLNGSNLGNAIYGLEATRDVVHVGMKMILYNIGYGSQNFRVQIRHSAGGVVTQFATQPTGDEYKVVEFAVRELVP